MAYAKTIQCVQRAECLAMGYASIPIETKNIAVPMRHVRITKFVAKGSSVAKAYAKRSNRASLAKSSAPTRIRASILSSTMPTAVPTLFVNLSPLAKLANDAKAANANPTRNAAKWLRRQKAARRRPSSAKSGNSAT